MTKPKNKELEHLYGPNVHIFEDPYLLTHLSKLCQETTKQPLVNQIIGDLYVHLMKEVLNSEFPKKKETIATRMANINDRGFWSGEIIDPDTHAVTVNIARAGTLPSQVCYEMLNKTLDADLIRQDHIIMARTTDDKERVTGVKILGSKIGGNINGAVVLFPDPMGATGVSLSTAIEHYKTQISGKALKFITLNLIVTPEFIKSMIEKHPDVLIYALRLDRGASAPEILNTVPGTHWDQESGLTDKQYIIPGGGGFGEIMNNAFC